MRRKEANLIPMNSDKIAMSTCLVRREQETWMDGEE